jgi:hypothetical protein
MTPRQLLAALHAGGDAADSARRALAYAAGTGTADVHAAVRRQVVDALIASLLPTDRAVARWLLEQEVAAHRAAGQGASDALYALVAALARFGDPDDALLIWHAREATPETRAGVDVEHLARAGVERVRARLRALAAHGGARGAEAGRALAWLDAGVAAGALDDLAAYFAWSDERFGLVTDAPT